MKKYIISLLCMMPVFTGCLDIKLENQFSDPDAITTVDTARELLATAYSSIPRYQMEFSVLSDDFYPTTYANQYAEMQNLYNWQDNAITDLSSQVWNDYYMTVAYLNALLDRIDNVKTEDEAGALELQNVHSEALALKAYCYFDLLRIYAPAYSEDVLDRDGIILKNRLELDFLPRSSVRVCVEEIASLLSEAAKVSNTGNAVYYFGSDAVNALRAEFELYRGAYDAAVEYGLPLLSDLESRLTETEYSNLWTENESQERIFAPYIFDSFYINLNYDRESGDYFCLAGGVTYEDTDMRKSWCEYQGPQTGVRSLGKYNRMYYENTEVRYINTLRYSGVCFTVAEAYARDGQPGEAVALMNRYLGARGCTLLDESLSGDALVDAILTEKQREFVGEGVRYFDLKRIGRPLDRYNAAGNRTSTIAADDYRHLFPIPQSEYRYNENITAEHQNPGWSYEVAE